MIAKQRRKKKTMRSLPQRRPPLLRRRRLFQQNHQLKKRKILLGMSLLGRRTLRSQQALPHLRHRWMRRPRHQHLLGGMMPPMQVR